MIPLAIPNLCGREGEYLQECIKSEMVSSVGPFVGQLEEALAKACGAAGAVATASGTTALQSAMATLGIGRDDLVISPSFTFIASSNAISHTGASPWLFDVDDRSWTIDPALVAERLEKDCRRDADGTVRHIATGRRVAALLPVFTLGAPADMDALAAVAEAYGLPLIVDAAAALGALYKGKPLGATGAVFACLSFNGNKTITTGGGGAIIGNDLALLKRAKHLTTTARVGLHYDHDEIGYNFRMTNVQAAIGCAQMENLEFFLRRKREIEAIYRAALVDNDRLRPFPELPGCRSTFWFSGVQITDFDEQKMLGLIALLRNAGIDARLFWKPVHLQKPYKNAQQTGMSVSERIWPQVLVLPCSTQLDEKTQSFVIDAVKTALRAI